MNPPRIGFVTCIHPMYDLPAVAAWRENAMDALRQSGCDVIAAAIPRTPADAQEIAAHLAKCEVDVVVLFFCSWVSEEVTLALARAIGDIPLFLWALPFLDLDIPMPSPISGITGSGSNIRRLGKPFAFTIGSVNAATIERVAKGARAASAVRALGRARLGVVGETCPGMVDVVADESALRRALGVETVHFTLDELLSGAQAAPPAEVESAGRRLVAAAGGGSEVSDRALGENAGIYVAIREMVRANRLDAYCIRCWPEMRNEIGITACTAHALMAEDGIASTCEVDVPALITTWLLSRLAGAPAFNFDITAYIEEQKAVQFAHCGAADPSLAGDGANVRLRTHMRTGTGATLEFPFREGTVTLAKLLRPVDGKLRLFVAGGRAISSVGARGSVATVQPEPSAEAFLAAMMRHAVEHHVALVYGDWKRELELFCQFTGVELVSPGTGSDA